MWMKHIQGEHLLRQPNGQKLVASNSFSHQRCHAAPSFAASCMFIRKPGRAPQQVPPTSALGSVPHPHLSPTWHRASGSTRHMGLSQTACLNYRCVHWQRALGSCSSCSPRADTGDCMGGWRGREASCKLFLSVFTAHAAQTCNWAATLCFPLCFHIQLLGFASQGSLQLQAGSASCTQHPKFHLLWARRMPVKLWVPSSSGHPPRKTSSEDFHMQTHSHCEQHSALQSKSTSHKHHSPVRVWKSLQPPGKKKYYEKKSEGWINWACSCLLYISDVTKFMLLHRNFFSF